MPDRIRFRTHCPGTLEEAASEDEWSGTRRARPDRYCIHRMDEDTEHLVTTFELKAPPKLDVQSLRTGLWDVDFVREVIQQDMTPTDVQNDWSGRP